MLKKLLIVVVEADPDRAQAIAGGLNETGDHDIRIVAEQSSLARQVADLNPDVVLIDIANPSRDILEELALASGPSERPVAMFVDRSDEQLTRSAIEAGISAYVVDGLRTDRIRPIIDAAVARFRMLQRLRTELATTRAALEDRKIVDRAKAVLMKARGIDEDEAYALLRKTAMDQGKRIGEIAQQLVTAAGLLGR